MDPWTSELEGSLEGEGRSSALDLFVETEDWRPLVPPPATRPVKIAFVDGVQRIEAWLLSRSDFSHHGMLASIAVGALSSERGKAAVISKPPLRALLAQGEIPSSPLQIPAGDLLLQFIPFEVPGEGPSALREALNKLREEEEMKLGRELASEDFDLVVLDGRLRFRAERGGRAVGLIKSIYALYLPQELLPVLEELPPGGRTPLFTIPHDPPLFAWFVRLAPRRRIDHPLSGLVRLEASADLEIEEARKLADLTASHLPRFASPTGDPRSPQQLLPFIRLEEELRKLLGDAGWVRRAIEMWFWRGG